MNIQPLGARILVRVDNQQPEHKTAGGIIIPTEEHAIKYKRASVVALGDPKEDSKIITKLSINDTVILSKYAGTEVSGDLLIIQEDEVLGKITD